MPIVHIEKLVFGGQGLAKIDGKAVFVWNALPGEEVEIQYLKNKKDFAEAVAVKIINPSPDRIEPKENHYLSSAPWEMMTAEAENRYKKQVSLETYERNGGLILSDEAVDLVFDEENQYGYRNKIEFSFAVLDSGEVALSFFNRGTKVRLPIISSLLSEPVINEVSASILDWINQEKIPMRSLKSIIVRSNGRGQAIAALFIKDRLIFDNYPDVNDKMLGFTLYYSTHKSPASVPTELLYQAGQDFLEAVVLGTKLKFGILSFFQVNIPIFELALADIKKFIPAGGSIVDYYSGVGSISLPLRDIWADCALVDIVPEAIEYAKDNIESNKIKNAEAICAPAEKITDLINHDKIIILDPPRAGLHKKVIDKILLESPPRVIYLSCNLSTQARDIKLLSEKYRVIFVKLYNFFPRTPHIEGLCVLDRM